jgi:N-methylhydantoinase A
VHAIVNAAMGAAVHMVTVARGIDPRDFVIVSLGGAAPAHVALVAAQFGITTVLVPPHSGVGSALGLLSTDLRADRSVSRLTRADRADPDALERVLDDLAGRAAEVVGGDVRVERSVDVRYAGQGHEFTMPLPPGRLDLAALTGAFYARYRDEYGIDLRDPVELVTFRARATRAVRTVRPAPPRGPRRRPVSTRRVAYFGRLVDTPVHERAACAPGDRFDGPVLIEEPESTLVVPPGWAAEVLGDGTVRLRA